MASVVTSFLIDYGFVRSPSDAAVFYLRRLEQPTVFCSLHVDDIFIACSALSSIVAVKCDLLERFLGKYFGEDTCFLQMSIRRERSRRMLSFCQQRHADALVMNYVSALLTFRRFLCRAKCILML
jgi:hypothetical protein